MKRYRDAYLVSRFVVLYGTVTKIGAVLTTIVIFLLEISWLSLGTSLLGSQQQIAGLMAFVAVGIALFFGFLVWCAGVLISAYGQHLKASLDTAVHSSPFLSDAQRAEVMSLD
jgi:hypothetical protein